MQEARNTFVRLHYSNLENVQQSDLVKLTTSCNNKSMQHMYVEKKSLGAYN